MTKSRRAVRRVCERGFALVTTLLLLTLVTGLAIAVMYLAMTQQQISGSDKETSEAFYGGEAGMEKMMADLANLYQQKQSPSIADLYALSSQQPTLPGIYYTDPNSPNAYSISAMDNGSGFPASYTSTVASGPNQGLIAQIIPINLAVTARRAEGTEARMFRKVEVALIPVFQFGVFCDADCSYFPGPQFNFAGRVHTNGNLWLASGASVIFHDKVTAVGNVVRMQLANTYNANGGQYNGDVWLPTAPNGCGVYPATSGSNCAKLSFSEGSVTKGNYCAAPNNDSAPNCDSSSAPNSSVWNGVSGKSGRYHDMLINGTTGATKLSLPFVGADVLPIEIIRRAQAGDTTTLSSSRLYNQAGIRILLDDNPFNLSSKGPADPDNVPLAAVANGGLMDSSSWSAGGKKFFVATASNASNLIQVGSDKNGKAVYGADKNWYLPYLQATQVAQGTAPVKGKLVDPFTYQSGAVPDGADGAASVKTGTDTYVKPAAGNDATDWPLLSGWIRIEVFSKAGAAGTPVTREWLKLGFTRQFNEFPNSEKGIKNKVYADSILLLQQQMNPNRAQVGVDAKKNPVYADVFNPVYASKNLETQGYDLLPLNFYDPREGELRDTNDAKSKPAGSCSANGVMNAVELDVGNLYRWLKGDIGASGKSVDNSTSNGYILYFSDRRGGSKDGGYDYLDTINATNSIKVTSNPIASVNVTSGMPDGTLSAEEDVYQGHYPTPLGGSGTLTTPPRYIGAAFGLGEVNAGNQNPGVASRMDCASVGGSNIVLAPRHVLRLVNGSFGNVPKRPDGSGGFTVASEQPVYVVGNYNADAADGLPQDTTTNSAAAVIADTVTLLSTAYDDLEGLKNPFNFGGARKAGTSYYRLAIASGKTLTFKQPSSADPKDFGTDGGVHNFLRFLEDWSGVGVYYQGSMVSLYYSAYGTGAFKCCTDVYTAPDRHYSFDTNFLTPSLLPPGTPQFKDVVDLGYVQNMNP